MRLQKDGLIESVTIIDIYLSIYIEHERNILNQTKQVDSQNMVLGEPLGEMKGRRWSWAEVWMCECQR